MAKKATGKRLHEWDGTQDVPQESVVLPSGRRLTDDVVEELLTAARKEARRVGRPSLTSAGKHSPRVSFRVAERTQQRAMQVAAAAGVSVSELGRQALEEYLDRHQSSVAG